MTFREYLQRRRITDTPVGDFVMDARDDKRMPDPANWDDLRRYLSRNVPLENKDTVLSAARQVWRGYQDALRKASGA